MEVNIYIGFETLKMKCNQYGICEQVAFKNASTLVFSKSGWRAAVFGRVQENCRGLPSDRIFPSPEKFVRGSLTSSFTINHIFVVNAMTLLYCTKFGSSYISYLLYIIIVWLMWSTLIIIHINMTFTLVEVHPDFCAHWLDVCTSWNKRCSVMMPTYCECKVTKHWVSIKQIIQTRILSEYYNCMH